MSNKCMCHSTIFKLLWRYLYRPETKFVVKEGIKDKYCTTTGYLSKYVDKEAEGYDFHYLIINIEEKKDILSYEEDEKDPSFGIKTGISYWFLSFICFLEFFLI